MTYFFGLGSFNRKRSRDWKRLTDGSTLKKRRLASKIVNDVSNGTFKRWIKRIPIFESTIFDCIKYNVDLGGLHTCITIEQVTEELKQLTKKVDYAQKVCSEVLMIDAERYNNLDTRSKQLYANLHMFEQFNFKLNHRCCRKCKIVSLW